LESLILVGVHCNRRRGAKNAYQSDVTKDFSNSGDEAEVAIDLLNIAGNFQVVPTPTPTTSTSPSKPFARFYVEMPFSPPTPTNNQQDELMVNLEDSNPKLDDLTIPTQTQGITKLGDLLFLPILLTRRKHGK
jgi:hypothetical protein